MTIGGAPRRIGIYGGSFDPIHHGHLILARDALEQFGLNRVHFVTARLSPHKLHRDYAPAELRHAMVEAALAGSGCFVSDARELSRPGPSYAIDTARELAAEYPGAELWYFVGEDNLPGLPSWHEYEALCALVRFAVFARGPESVPSGYPVVTRRLDISSTEIRNRIATGLNVEYLLPESVLAQIARHHLYEVTP